MADKEHPLEVFWRPSCPFCVLLRADLKLRGVRAHWRNIWEDEEARDIVRAANGGHETVPTVRYGDITLTNPSGSAVRSLIA
ncbi:MAG: glutaredoxin domain-containing protein [Propionibacteriaceae bacterium]|nr:glutaredoxin domain-containing protein [Propionibacteriaceae bacterium]